MTRQAILSRNEQWLTAWVGQEMLMMSGSTGFCLNVSETGGRIWDLLAQPLNADQICEALGEEYPAARDQMQSAVSAFLDDLLREDAIRLEQYETSASESMAGANSHTAGC